MPDQVLPGIPLPSGWAKNVQSAVLHVVSLAHFDIIDARGLAAKDSDVAEEGQAAIHHRRPSVGPRSAMYPATVARKWAGYSALACRNPGPERSAMFHAWHSCLGRCTTGRKACCRGPEFRVGRKKRCKSLFDKEGVADLGVPRARWAHVRPEEAQQIRLG